jgi:copper transport protein
MIRLFRLIPGFAHRMLVARHRSLVWVVAIAAALVLAVHAAADAHTTLVSSEPAAGSRLSASPARVRLVFSEQVEAGMANLAIVGADGRVTALVPAGDPHDVHAIVAPVSPLPNGTFRITWHVVSADGHPVGGSFIFTVGQGGAVAPPPPIETPPAATWGPTVRGAPLVPAVLRGLGVGCLMAGAGLLFFIVWMNAAPAPRPLRVARLLTLAAPILLGAHFLAWVVNASPDHSFTSTWMSAAMESTVGRTELVRTLLALPPLWALWLARRPLLALWLAVPALLVSAAVGHSAAVDPMLAVPAKAIHLVAIAAWMGGLLWLVVREPGDRAAFLLEVTRISTVSLAAVIAIAVTGVIQTFLLLHLDHLWSTYGAVVGAKVLGFAVLIAFGAHHRFRVLPRLLGEPPDDDTRSSFRTTLRREIVVMSVVILLGGFLSYVSPPAAAGAGDANHLEHPESSS